MSPATDRVWPPKLRICDGDGERVLVASARAVEYVFAPGRAVSPGTEISLVDGERILVALSVGSPAGDATGDVEFLLWRVTGEHAALCGPVNRREAIAQFRKFVLTAGERAKLCAGGCR